MRLSVKYQFAASTKKSLASRPHVCYNATMVMTASDMARKRWEGVGTEERSALARKAVSAMWKRLNKTQRMERATRAAKTRAARKAKP